MSCFNITMYVAPSGGFVSTDHEQILPLTLPPSDGWTLSYNSIFNPALLEQYRGGDYQVPESKAPYNLIRGLEVADRVVSETELEVYARVVRQLATDLQVAPS